MASCVIYETHLLNPIGEFRIYIGSHSPAETLWSPSNPNGYIGSGHIFQKRIGTKDTTDGHTIGNLKDGWKHCVTKPIVLIDSTDWGVEGFYIKEYAKKYGIAPEVCQGSSINHFCKSYQRPTGLILNTHCNDCSHLWTEEARLKWKKAVDEYWKTDKSKENLKRLQEIARTPESLQNLHKSLVLYYSTSEGRESQRIKSLKACSEESLKKTASLKKYRKENPEIGMSWAKDMQSKEIVEKRRNTRLNNSPLYRISDGFEGNRHEIAEHLNTTVASVAHWIQRIQNGYFRVAHGKFKGLEIISI